MLGVVRLACVCAMVAAATVSPGLVATAAGQGGTLSTPLPNVGPPLLLRLEGTLEPSKAAAERVGFTAASLGFTGRDSGPDRWLGVTTARTVGGDQPLDGKDVLAAVAPFVPNLLVVGPPALAAELRAASAGTPVRVEGLVGRGSRTYYLRSLRLGSEAEQP
jgi:hypothetical protein